MKNSIRGYFRELGPAGPQPPFKITHADAAILDSCGISTEGFVIPDPFKELYEILDQLKEISHEQSPED